MLSMIHSMGLQGMDAYPVSVETDLTQGTPSFDVVGLPDATVRESRERVRAAMKNTGFDFPISRIVANLAPADIRKEGAVYDVPLLLALMRATHQLNVELNDSVFVGELSLAGEVRPVSFPEKRAQEAEKLGLTRLLAPRGTRAKVKGGKIEVLEAGTLIELLDLALAPAER